MKTAAAGLSLFGDRDRHRRLGGLRYFVLDIFVGHFFNADLVEQAGGDPDTFPSTWPEIIELAASIEALDDESSGMHLRRSFS